MDKYYERQIRVVDGEEEAVMGSDGVGCVRIRLTRHEDDIPPFEWLVEFEFAEAMAEALRQAVVFAKEDSHRRGDALEDEAMRELERELAAE